MSTHDIHFPREIRKNIDTFGLKKVSYQELRTRYSHLSVAML